MEAESDIDLGDVSSSAETEAYVIEEGMEVEEDSIEIIEVPEIEENPMSDFVVLDGTGGGDSNEAFLTAEDDGEVIEIQGYGSNARYEHSWIGHQDQDQELGDEFHVPPVPDVGCEDVIDGTGLTEVAVDHLAQEGQDEEQGNGNEISSGQNAQMSDFIEDVETESESVMEITRRRLSHEGICYCGKDRNLNIAELLCASCHRWYHESCIGYQLGKLVPFMMNYIFICKNCSATGLESFKRSPATFVQICVTAIANLQQSSAKEKANCQRFSKEGEIIPFIDIHWEGITPTRRSSHAWQTAVSRTLVKDMNWFTKETHPKDPGSPYFGLLDLDLTQIRPNYEAMIQSGFLKLGDYTSGTLRRGGTKRRTVDGSSIFAQSQAAVAKKTKGDTFIAKPFGAGFGYPTEHPINKDGYRYILAEPDSTAPFRQDFDESSDWAGKPIPGFLYRVLIPPNVFLAVHDRAPQLKVSDDKLSVTGEKGYCMIRASHWVTKGNWFFEVKVVDLPENAACRMGWGQCYANLQAPLGFDKFGYCWRSRLGTKFHQAIGRTYCPGGYGVGDVLGFLIILPEHLSHAKNIYGPTDPPSVPESFKDKPLVRFKSHLYYEDKDISAEVEVNDVRFGSKMICYKNGVCQGVAYDNLYEGCYYPSISLYKNATVKANFGPKFEFPPPKTDFEYKPFQERAEDAILEQTMSDILFLTENDGKLSLENAVAVPN